MDSYRFILSGGGTGGHIYPAIAIANELKKRYPSSEILFVGAKDKMEMEKVPQAGYKIKGLWISGLQRKLTLKNLMFPFKVLSSLLSARKIIKQFKPSLVVGTGGYASGPLVKMASSAGIPSVLQEQNSYAGITNKMLSKNAQKICVAYDDMDQFFPKDKIVKTGNPVRSDLVSIKDSKKASAEFFALNPNQTTLLVLGGSLGARMINQLIKNELEFFKNHGVQVLWQCGKLYHNDYLKFDSDRVKITPFITDMAKAYALADIIVSRAGAGSVSELCLVGKPTIFIPSPNVAEDHQTKNALALVEKDAAMMIKESELEQKFEAEFEALLGSKEKQIKLSNNIKKLALPKATEHIVNEIEKLLKWI